MKKNSSSLLDGVTFEDIMSEKAIQTESPNRGNRLAGAANKPHNKSTSSDSSVNFSIIKNYGKLSNGKNAATFALVDWNGFNRYDLRSWNEDYSVPYKGITFSPEEIPDLLNALSCYKKSTYKQARCIYSAGKANAKIYDLLCTLSSSSVRGVLWNKQVNIVDWGYGLKLDFRKWNEDYTKCSKGICLSDDEASVLVSILMKL